MHKNGQLEYERVTPMEARSPVKIIELYLNKTPCHVLSNNNLCLRSMCSTYYCFPNFTELHALTLAAHFLYALARG